MVTIPARFNGPEHSGNGGYVGGLLAEQLDTDAPVFGDAPMFEAPEPMTVGPPAGVASAASDLFAVTYTDPSTSEEGQ